MSEKHRRVSPLRSSVRSRPAASDKVLTTSYARVGGVGLGKQPVGGNYLECIGVELSPSDNMHPERMSISATSGLFLRPCTTHGWSA